MNIIWISKINFTTTFAESVNFITQYDPIGSFQSSLTYCATGSTATDQVLSLITEGIHSFCCIESDMKRRDNSNFSVLQQIAWLTRLVLKLYFNHYYLSNSCSTPAKRGQYSWDPKLLARMLLKYLYVMSISLGLKHR